MNEKYTRICPECKIEETDYSSKYTYEKAIKNNSVCRRCRNIGKNNPMFGKKSHLLGKKLSESQKEKIRKNTKILIGKDNPSYKKSFYQWWVEKYGKEKADNLLLEFKKKQSELNKGKNNSMYGKPAPQGSGNGWSGWYKGWYFRSLRELSYMIKVIERFKMKWESGEQKDYLIPYLNWDGNKKNYFCDFIINKKYLVECKPKKLHQSVSVKVKTIGALNFCKKNKLKYKLISPTMLTDDEIMKLYKFKKIKFLKRYERKFREKYIK